MLEKNYNYSLEDVKNIERIVDDDNVNINHMVLPKGERLPEHFSNSNVYMIIVNGIMTIQLNDQEPHKYKKGDIISIPYKIKMNVINTDENVLEFFVVKSPNPKNYKEK